MNNWISVKDKLPKDYNQYLVFIRQADMGHYVPWYDVLRYDFRKNKWCQNSPMEVESEYINYLTEWYNVEYWQKLPKIPKS